MMLRTAALAVTATLSLSLTGPAMADSLSLYGSWGGPAVSSKSSLFGKPSYLGATQKALQYSAKPINPKPVELAEGGEQPEIKAREPELVTIVSRDFAGEYGPGSIVVDTAKRRLYYILSPELAYAYPIAVGKEGFTWTGAETVSKIVHWPEWMPPEEMRDRKPSLPIKMTGGLNNPLGARAIYLGKTLYRIHGTNDPKSIGSASSSGCFRMHNMHVAHLAGLVTPKMTKVHVLKRVDKSTFVAWKPASEPAATAVKKSGKSAGRAGERNI